MGLNRVSGNMYGFVTHTHTHLGGVCAHECEYCLVKSMPFERLVKYRGELRLVEGEFDVRYSPRKGKKMVIFMENCNDLFAQPVPLAWIRRVFEHCGKFEGKGNVYLWQTKNPKRYVTMPYTFPERSIVGATIESNRSYLNLSYAPPVDMRMKAMARFHADHPEVETFVTMEPVLDFDIKEMREWIREMGVSWVVIGAESKGHSRTRVLEPPAQKVMDFIDQLRVNDGLEVRVKDNLKRILEKEEKKR